MSSESERAVSYRQMMENWAWKDFNNFLESERQSALEDSINLNDLSQIQVKRGMVKAFDSIKSHLGFVLGESV